MSELKDVLLHILKQYPYKQEMSNARITKIIYLSDWYHAMHHHKQISPINWYFDNYGPFVWDIYNTAKNDDMFEIKITKNLFGTEKKLISLKNDVDFKLDESEAVSVDEIINKTKELNWNSFIKLVYSTYPILSSDKYDALNLVEKAKEYELIKI